MNSVLLLSYIVVVLIAKPTTSDEINPLSDEFINSINEQQSLWKAGRNFREDIPMNYIKKLGGCLMESDIPELPQMRHDLADVNIPESFDWRDSNLNCSSITCIRDQGACGSCWAIAVAEVITDRICIHSKGNLDVYISAVDLLSCCRSSSTKICPKSDGCNGGYPSEAFDYWYANGIVSGGPYGSNQGCRPYEIPPCEHHVNGPRPSCDSMNFETPPCKRNCRTGYSASYKDDLQFGKNVYYLPTNIQQIQTEIMKNGPITAAFTIYEDFFSYKTGIYKHTIGKARGGHAVKMIGWGVENDTPYWLLANSWNTDWGDNGYFKILRGENHCGIEGRTFGGIPA